MAGNNSTFLDPKTNHFPARVRIPNTRATLQHPIRTLRVVSPKEVCRKVWMKAERHEKGPIGDALIYREYTLGLIWPRRCPDYLDDDVVSEWLNHCAKAVRLPWKQTPGV